MITIDLQGEEKILRVLSRFEQRPLDTTLRKASMKGARSLVRPMRQESGGSKKSGRLAKSISARKSNRGIGALVGPRARHRHLVIQGTRPHTIRPKDEGSLRFGGRHAEVVEHPGSKPDPFVDRTARAHGRVAVEAVGDELEKLMKA